jgi:hypothetical protein
MSQSLEPPRSLDSVKRMTHEFLVSSAGRAGGYFSDDQFFDCDYEEDSGGQS